MQENLFKIGDKFNLPDSNDTFEITDIGAVDDGELRYTGRRMSPLGSYYYTSYSSSNLLHNCIQTVWAEDADALDDWWEIYYANFIKTFAEVFPTPVIFGTPKVCECGMEKHNFANHSTWCPKHE